MSNTHFLLFQEFHHVSSLTNRGWVTLQIFLPRSLIKSHNSMWVTTHVFICQAFTPCVIWSPGGGWHSILIFPGHLIIISSHLMQGVSVTQTFFLLPNSLITSHCIMNTDCKSHYLPTKQSYNYSSSYIQQTVGGIPIFFTIQCLWIMIITYLITKEVSEVVFVFNQIISPYVCHIHQRVSDPVLSFIRLPQLMNDRKWVEPHFETIKSYFIINRELVIRKTAGAWYK